MESYLNSHYAGRTAWIDMLYVVPECRGQGEGRHLYQRFEDNLPFDIEVVEVFAADTEGHGNSDEFWLHLGFTYRYDGDEDALSYEAAHTLFKGVNGHPTPSPILIT
jgi:GNAT superfamily N-acetyltransferase